MILEGRNYVIKQVILTSAQLIGSTPFEYEPMAGTIVLSATPSISGTTVVGWAILLAIPQ